MVKAAAEHVFALFKERLPEGMFFHDFVHTLETTEIARSIAQALEVSEEQLELLTLAALFHDTGYTEAYEGHEEASTVMARDFLSARGMAPEALAAIEGCILATKVPQQPKNLLEEILVDADLYNLASEQHLGKAKALRREWSARQIKTFSDEEWLDMEVRFLANTRFHTAWAQRNWKEGRMRNLEHAEQELADLKRRKKKKKAEKEESKRKEELGVLKVQRPDRGIETMFRTAARNHINLSSIADNKANIMLSINALIISVVISGLAPKLDTNPSLLIPTSVLLAVCILSIIFATLSTRPKITKGRFDRDDIAHKKSNLLFFGNFYNMKLEDYEWGMSEMMKDRDFLYGSLTRDLYYLGVVLARKYYFLRLTYTVFMWGLIIAVLAFGVSFYLDAQGG